MTTGEHWRDRHEALRSARPVGSGPGGITNDQ
jgi:hypothetical protein